MTRQVVGPPVVDPVRVAVRIPKLQHRAPYNLLTVTTRNPRPCHDGTVRVPAAPTAAALGATVLVLTSLAGCGEEVPASPVATASDPSPTRSEPDPGDPPDSSEPGDTAAPLPDSLDFTATTVEGGSFEGASLAGKPALLWFWAPWCPTCRSQVPQVESLAEEYADDVAVIGVGSLDSAEAIAAFAADVDGVTHLEDVDGALYRKFGIAEQSSFVLLDADGDVAFETGYGGSDDLADEVGAVAGSAG